jgi:hypothetical protein
MMNAAAVEVLTKVAWGRNFRVFLGAGVSIADALSDGYMINQFFEMGDTGTAYGLLAMVSANITIQLILVFMQNHGLKKNKRRTLAFECLSVVTFSKPGKRACARLKTNDRWRYINRSYRAGFEAWRVASQAKPPEGAPLDPVKEMAFTKGSELVTEALPGLVLQLFALVHAEEKIKSAVVSVLISTMSAALTATIMFWDSDTDPATRARNPEVGIVPNFGRTKAFAVIVFMCTCQIVAKVTAMVLLAATKAPWLIIYCLADYAAFFAYLAMRRDLVCYVPTPSAASFVAAPIYNIFIKTTTDFTGSLLMRLPLMQGAPPTPSNSTFVPAL